MRQSSILAAAFAAAASASPYVPNPCVVTTYAGIAAAVANCTDITLQDIHAPTNSSIDLSAVKANSKVTFAGCTTFAFTNSSDFNPIVLAGKNVTITGARGHVIDGNGGLYWDGLGSNGGLPKPHRMLTVSKMTLGSVIENLHIKNWPSHLFSITTSSDLTIQNLHLDNRDGDAPNNRSGTLAAAHNSDGFDLSTSNNTIIKNTMIWNQDDCVAVTSGNNITIDNLFCSGGHGLSIGSVGGKANNNVTNVTFKNSALVNSSNGCRIKSNYNTTGYIANITYSNILLTNISTYGIDVQEDYLNGGPTGIPSNGVIMENFLFENVKGTMEGDGQPYYILCGDGACSNFVFKGVHVVGGTTNSSCNFPATGCPV